MTRIQRPETAPPIFPFGAFWEPIMNRPPQHPSASSSRPVAPTLLPEVSARWLIVSAAIAVWSMGVLSTVGCGRSKDLPALGTVSGTVTLDGKPLEHVTVVFEAKEGRTAFGSTDASGRYELFYMGRHKGAVLGPNKVAINSQIDAPPGPGWKDPIPQRYNAKTELKADVVAEKNTFDFPLESK
jgi:hypothetical protein